MHTVVAESRPRVLVVDDERGPRESLRLVLKPYFEVATASTAAEALEFVRSGAVDVVTLDLKMPGIDGPQALSDIKRIDPDLEVVIVTGFGSLESVIEVLKLRAFDYIPKPFDASEVVQAVRQAVESRRRRIEAREAVSYLGTLDEIVGRVEHWCEESAERLGMPDRDALEEILTRLQTLRARIHLDRGETH